VSNLARGDALDVHVKSANVETKRYDAVPTLDVSASYDAEAQEGAVFLVNRSQTETVLTDLVWQDGQALVIEKAWQLAGGDPKAVNSWDAPEQVVAKAIPEPTVEAGRATIELPPLSFTVLTTCPE
jgi:alpha-N-arabinofuranosidase